MTISYPLNAGALLDTDTPSRLGDAYVYFCMTGQRADRGEIIVRLPNRYAAVTSGSAMTDESVGLTTGNVPEPGDLFACVEGTVERDLAEATVVGPADRQIVLQARPEDDAWLGPARQNVVPALDRLHAFLGQDIPGDRPLVVRMTPPAGLGGYASDHSTPGVVQLDENAGVGGAEHEMAHAWFGADRFRERWMREGLAEWAARRVDGEECPALSSSPANLDLSTWEVERPSAPADVETVIVQQQDAACGIMGLLASRMGDDAFKGVLATMLAGEAKYVGSAEPGRAVADVVDWMEFLDAVDERGLVPAGDEDLDFAQTLLASYGIADDPSLLEQRSAIRARYHDFLTTSAPLAAPALVRTAIDEWRFADASSALDLSERVLADLTSADALLPEAGLVPFIQPGFESAETPEALEAVRVEAASLLAAAEQILPPLNELREVTPAEWTLPAAVRSAVTEQRFDDALAAVEPALDVAREVSAADAALPEAGLRQRYRAQYEAAATGDALEALADRVAEVRIQSETVGIELEALRSAAGDWVDPRAVTDPITGGQIASALAIAQDARGVVTAARQADLALPEAHLATDFRPRFEAVRSGSEMAALRIDAEAARDTAETIGESYSELSSTVSDWTLPAIITSPIAERDFETAAATLSAAATWVRYAAQADANLPEVGEFLARARAGFEGATSLSDLESGADLAEDWATASRRVADAIAVTEADRDMMTTFGMFGTDLAPLTAQAVAAAQEGDVALATQRAQALVDAINEGSRNGGLRLAGIVFLIVAVIGVLGLWWLFRRNQGPPWARNTRPPWAEKPSKRAISPLTRRPPADPRR